MLQDSQGNRDRKLVVAHTFNFSTREEEAGGSRPASSMERVPGQPMLDRKTLPQTQTNQPTNPYTIKLLCEIDFIY